MANPSDHSFTFGTVDMRTTYGIVIERVNDVLGPPLRERKLVIPGRHGAYDFGARYYDERELSIVCATSALLTRGAARELSYTLSQKDNICIWDEPDKVYKGRIYDPSEIERLVRHFRKFSLVFVCDPFAYGATSTLLFDGDRRDFAYPGTAETPTRFEITNVGQTDAAQLRIRVRERRT